MGVRKDLESLIGKKITKVELVESTESYSGAGILLAHIFTEGEPAPWRNPVVIGLQQQQDYGPDEAFDFLDRERDGDEDVSDTEGVMDNYLPTSDAGLEPEHRYNSAPFCAKCGGPCLMRNGKDDVNCRHCGAWLFARGPSWVDSTNGDACPVHSESTAEATGVSTNLPHEPERPAQHGWAWAFEDDSIWQQTVKVTEALWRLGLTRAAVYQDGTSGGLICVRIPLDDSTDPDQGRALFVVTEDRDPAAATWHGQVIEADGEVGDLRLLTPATELQLDLGVSTDDVAAVVQDTVTEILSGNTD